MSNPYRGRPDHTFWKQGVTDCLPAGVDPIIRAAFVVRPEDKIATAGSCFAQHIARTLLSTGYQYLVTEHFVSSEGTTNENYGVFPARFGNLYTVRQLVQLFQRAYGSFVPKFQYAKTNNGGFVDLFRPRIQTGGFPAIGSLLDDRETHFAAARQMFESCDLFIFTLGLTETWCAKVDGAVYPLAPGVVSNEIDSSEFSFYNFDTAEVKRDLSLFISQLNSVNPRAKLLLTISPVSLVATYEDRHVLVSTIASKSILRAAVEAVVREYSSHVAYFPSYEIITGPQSKGRFFKEDLREVSDEGVSYVMSLFTKHYLTRKQEKDFIAEKVQQKSAPPPIEELKDDDYRRMNEIASIVCDEEAIIQ